MNKNIKQIIIVLVTIVIVYLAYKLIMGLFWALTVGIVLYIAYKLTRRSIGKKKKEKIE